VKLYEAPSPNARRVHIFMAEKGIDCERVGIDIRGAQNRTEEYLAKNPAGRVPVLELDDGSFLGESVAICRYFDYISPEPALFGTPGLEAARVEMWNRRAELNFMANVAAAFRNITGFFKDRETCVKEWGEVSARVAVDFVPMFDRQLENNQYLAGDRFSIADITFVVAWDFARQVKVVPLPDAPNITRWHQLVAARPSYSAV
jgi:glutathione S-transferase